MTRVLIFDLYKTAKECQFIVIYYVFLRSEYILTAETYNQFATSTSVSTRYELGVLKFLHDIKRGC